MNQPNSSTSWASVKAGLAGAAAAAPGRETWASCAIAAAKPRRGRQIVAMCVNFMRWEWVGGYAAARGWGRKSGNDCHPWGAKAIPISPLVSGAGLAHPCALFRMNPDQFWTSPDGQILTVKSKDERSVALTLAFWPRHPAEFEFLKAQLASLRFSERSSLARIGIEMAIRGAPHVEGNRLELEADAFIFDAGFPHAAYWKKLLRVGAPVGRLYHAPAAAKLATAEIWEALQENRLKLPNTISIDSHGRVFLTPHQLSYTLSQRSCSGRTSSGWWAGTWAATSSIACRCGTRRRR
jgi:hypothetical protein